MRINAYNQNAHEYCWRCSLSFPLLMDKLDNQEIIGKKAHSFQISMLHLHIDFCGSLPNRLILNKNLVESKLFFLILASPTFHITFGTIQFQVFYFDLLHRIENQLNWNTFSSQNKFNGEKFQCTQWLRAIFSHWKFYKTLSILCSNHICTQHYARKTSWVWSMCMLICSRCELYRIISKPSIEKMENIQREENIQYVMG